MNFSVFIITETSGSPGHVFFILLHWDKKVVSKLRPLPGIHDVFSWKETPNKSKPEEAQS